jgi:2-polyprenyl-3-methyl-5-hydroxy-6-metoxy-1,4-benzoquinol methylase
MTMGNITDTPTADTSDVDSSTADTSTAHTTTNPSSSENATTDDYARWKAWSEDRFGTFDRRAARYFDWHAKRACGDRSPLRVLEIGFGNGNFLGWAKDRGHDVIALERNPQLTARAHARGFRAVESLEAAAAHAPFDLIVAFDVIEHIEAAELAGMLRGLRGICAPGTGRLLVRYPNGDSPLSLVHQNGDMTHVTAIGVNMLRQLASMSGWAIDSMGEAPWTHDVEHGRNPRGLLRSLLRAGLEHAVGWAYHGSRVDWSPNMVAVLRPV